MHPQPKRDLRAGRAKAGGEPEKARVRLRRERKRGSTMPRSKIVRRTSEEQKEKGTGLPDPDQRPPAGLHGGGEESIVTKQSRRPVIIKPRGPKPRGQKDPSFPEPFVLTPAAPSGPSRRSRPTASRRRRSPAAAGARSHPR